ncbi:11392_t:CDS:1, partial [Cetraspora pellucida]
NIRYNITSTVVDIIASCYSLHRSRSGVTMFLQQINLRDGIRDNA